MYYFSQKYEQIHIKNTDKEPNNNWDIIWIY